MEFKVQLATYDISVSNDLSTCGNAIKYKASYTYTQNNGLDIPESQARVSKCHRS